MKPAPAAIGCGPAEGHRFGGDAADAGACPGVCGPGRRREQELTGVAVGGQRIEDRVGRRAPGHGAGQPCRWHRCWANTTSAPRRGGNRRARAGGWRQGLGASGPGVGQARGGAVRTRVCRRKRATSFQGSCGCRNRDWSLEDARPVARRGTSWRAGCRAAGWPILRLFAPFPDALIIAIPSGACPTAAHTHFRGRTDKIPDAVA